MENDETYVAEGIVVHNCRSTIVPLLAGEMAKRLGTPADGLAPKHGLKDYDAWLRTQSRATQDHVLGATRGGLWRNGKLPLRDLIDQDRRVLTLAQLAERFGVDQAGLRGLAA